MALENTQIQNKLTETFNNDVFNFHEERDIFTLEASADKITALILFLKNDSELQFHFLTDLCGIHYPDNESERQFAVVYHLHNWFENKRIRIKVYLNGEKPEIKTIMESWIIEGTSGKKNVALLSGLEEKVDDGIRYRNKKGKHR